MTEEPIKFSELVHYTVHELIKRKGWEIHIPREWVDLVLSATVIAIKAVDKYKKEAKDVR